MVVLKVELVNPLNRHLYTFLGQENFTKNGFKNAALQESETGELNKVTFACGYYLSSIFLQSTLLCYHHQQGGVYPGLATDVP